MRISDEIVNDIREQASITEVISHYIPLVKKGKGYTAVCPFHDDHDPSLSISEDKQIYKCFVCGNGGNVFSFVMNYKKISFPESVVEVAKVIGKPIEVELDKPKPISKYQKDYDLLDSMISYSNYLLTASAIGSQAKEYLIERGLEEDVINNFQIGFNPKDNVMYKYLKSKGFSDELMIKTNIGKMLNNGMADVFYGRILFPIHDRYGNPIAFTARSLNNDDVAKYINTGETEVYTKGDNLYNYHRVKDTIKKSGSIIVTEGVMDVIAYYRAGVNNVVATLGTACSRNQLELLKSLSHNIVLSYDGDKAGMAANMRLGQMCLKEGLNVQVIDNQTDLDPDEIIKEYGKNALRDLASKKIGFIDYALKQYKKAFNLDNYTDRKEYHNRIVELIDLLEDKNDQENYYNELFEITKIRSRAIEKQTSKQENRIVKTISYDLDGLTKAEYIILTQMAMSYKAVSIYQKELGCLLDRDNQELGLLIIDEYRNHKQCQLSRLYDEVTNQRMKDLIVNLSTIEILPEAFDEEVLYGAIEREKTELKKYRIAELKKKIASVEVLSKSETDELISEYERLRRELNS